MALRYRIGVIWNVVILMHKILIWVWQCTELKGAQVIMWVPRLGKRY